jgi:hypothetical protein
MKITPGVPFWVESATTADAVEEDTPTGYDTIHIFEAIPRFDEPIDGQTNKLKRKTAASDVNQRVRVKNSFSDDMPIGENVYVVLGADGLCEILVWECELPDG